MTNNFSDDPRVRYEQAMVDADIEGLARDPEMEAKVERWHREGLSPDECIERIKAHYTEPALTSAE